jgi:predicted metal-dependent hydrolase
MITQLQVGNIAVDVVMKDIKNVHLSVLPPKGRVRISAPSSMSIETIRIFAISKLGWIRQQQQKFQAQERETPREYVSRESHNVWGKRYLLKVIEGDEVPSVELTHSEIWLKVRPGTDRKKRQAILDEWYREQIKGAAQSLIAKWELVMGVEIKRLFVQRMKTRWGSCHRETKNIRLNTELAQKPREYLEYTVVHELLHLLVPTHNNHFFALMNRYLPKWRIYRDELNQLPLSHQEWAN